MYTFLSQVNYRCFRVILFLILFSTPCFGQNSISPLELKTDNLTLHSLSFRLIVSGDENNNANLNVKYRKVGATAWKNSIPLLRINGEPAGSSGEFTTGNLFAGGVVNLAPGTSYEVQLDLTDPDGVDGTNSFIRTVATRSEPPRAEGINTINVNGVSDLIPAAEAAQPGDVILINPGIYELPDGLNLAGILSSKATSESLPIVFRGTDQASVIFDGLATPVQGDTPSNFVDVRSTAHIYFENFTVRNAWIAFRADNAKGLVIRDMHIHDVRMGVRASTSYTAEDENWFIADNVITGWNPQWYPYDDPDYDLSHTGVNIYGRGHVVAYNTISKFWDCLAVQNRGVTNETVDWRDPPTRDIDFHNNELFECMDDGIELDYGFHNVRAYRNRIYNVHSGISVQPFYGGPALIFRNVIYNVALDNPFKLHNKPAGIDIYHNTALSSYRAWQVADCWVNARIYNNLMLGDESVTSATLDTGTPPHPRTMINNNGYTDNAGSSLVSWDECSGSSSYPDLPAFFAGTGYEGNGFIINYTSFVNAELPGGEGSTYAPGEKDLSLVATSPAVNAGLLLPSFNDGFTGTAPDVGAYEREKGIPHYGIRTEGNGDDTGTDDGSTTEDPEEESPGDDSGNDGMPDGPISDIKPQAPSIVQIKRKKASITMEDFGSGVIYKITVSGKKIRRRKSDSKRRKRKMTKKINSTEHFKIIKLPRGKFNAYYKVEAGEGMSLPSDAASFRMKKKIRKK